MQGNVAILEKLSSVVEKTVERDESMKTSIIDHLQSIEMELQRYFSELKKQEAAFLRNAVSISLAIASILDESQDQFCDFRNNSSARGRPIFHEMPLFRFWWAVRESFP